MLVRELDRLLVVDALADVTLLEDPGFDDVEVDILLIEVAPVKGVSVLVLVCDNPTTPIMVCAVPSET